MKLTVEFVCTEGGGEAGAHETGHKARLVVPLPPPEPAADGKGNPVYNPPPPSGVLQLFITSDARRSLLRQADGIRREMKKNRPELFASEDDKKRAVTKRKELEVELSRVVLLLQALKEFRFEKGESYTVTVEKSK